MSLRTKLSLMFVISAIVACAGTVTFNGPQLAQCGSTPPPAGLCPVIGDPLQFAVFSASLTQPTASNSNFVLTIMTNYGAPISGSSIPPFKWNSDGQLYDIADFLINWQGQDYGVILAPHIAKGVQVDNYMQGGLYQAPNQQFDLVTSGNILGVSSPRPFYPIWLAPPAMGPYQQLGTGTVNGQQTGNGTTSALYTITVQFSAPANFLSTGTFGIDFSSYVCANGYLTGTGTFTGGSGGTGGGTGGMTPEPASLLMLLPGLALVGGRLISQRRRRTA